MQFEDYLGLLGRRKLVIVASVILTAMFALIGSVLQPPKYSASAVILVTTPNAMLYGTNSKNQDEELLKLSNSIASSAVTYENVEELIKTLELSISPEELFSDISIDTQSEVGAIGVSVSSDNPQKAALIANKLSDMIIRAGDKNSDVYTTKLINALNAELDVKKQQIQELSKAINVNKANPASSLKFSIGQSANVSAIEYAEWTRLTNSYYWLSQKIDEINANKAGNSIELKMTEKAISPDTPYSPNTKKNILYGTVLGLIIGFVAALILEYSDASIRSEKDIERRLAAPIIGVIRGLSTQNNQKQKKKRGKLAFSSDNTEASVSYWRIVTNLQARLKRDDGKTVKALMFAAIEPHEFTSEVISNIALRVARTGKNTIILGCNPQNNQLIDFFRLKDRVGLLNALHEDCDISDFVIKTDVPNLSVVPIGNIKNQLAYSVELLSSPRMDQIIDKLKKQFDLILLDGSSIVEAVDAQILAQKVDTTILITQASRTTKKYVNEAAGVLTGIGASTMAVITINE
jgi:capsular exopolysaccharide synthesis family protein